MNGSNETISFLANETPTAVPEPSTWVLILAGMSGLFFIRRRKAQKA
jgi:hypothetical protein